MIKKFYDKWANYIIKNLLHRNNSHGEDLSKNVEAMKHFDPASGIKIRVDEMRWIMSAIGDNQVGPNGIENGNADWWNKDDNKIIAEFSLKTNKFNSQFTDHDDKRSILII